MKHALALGCVAALIAVAACNRGGGEEAPPPVNQEEAARNVAAGEATAAEIAAVMHARHEHYEEMGKAMKGITTELKGRSPSVDTIRRHAALIAGYGPELLTWFPEGSGPESGRDTRAKAEIWSDPETFRRRALAFREESARFSEIAQRGDAEAIREALPTLGNTCKNCHDRFRAPEDD
jgi:cytochrome c556